MRVGAFKSAERVSVYAKIGLRNGERPCYELGHCGLSLDLCRENGTVLPPAYVAAARRAQIRDLLL